jgi:hypothetical protein
VSDEPHERTGSRAFRCLMCDGIPAWRLVRHGDVVTTWACPEHLHLVADDLLEPGSHRTKLTLMHAEQVR